MLNFNPKIELAHKQRRQTQTKVKSGNYFLFLNKFKFACSNKAENIKVEIKFKILSYGWKVEISCNNTKGNKCHTMEV